MKIFCSLVVGAMFLLPTVAPAGPSPAQKCRGAKHKAVGGYHQCVLKAVSKAAKTGDPADVSKCGPKFTSKWDGAETKGNGECPDTITDTSEMTDLLTEQTDTVAALVAGLATAPTCGDDTVNAIGEHCDGADLNGTDCTDLGFSAGALACDVGCKFDAGSCTP